MNFRNSAGFTLLEISVMLVIVGVMIAFIMPAFTAQKMRSQNEALNNTLNAIEDALQSFRLKNNRLPCPAGFTYTPTDAAFGTASGSAGSCTVASAGSCAASAPIICRLTTNVVSGAVPVRALGLPDAMMLDPWGRRIAYAVDQRMTETDAFTAYPPRSLTGAIEVRDESGSARTSIAAVVLISHGLNGHGAYSRAGLRLNEGVSNASELDNCNCTSAAADGTLNNIFVQRATATGISFVANSFDDIVRFYRRGNFLSEADRVIP